MSLKNPLPVSNLDRKLPFQGISVTSFVCNLSAKKRKTKPRVYFDGSAPDDSRTLKPAGLTHCHAILAEDVNKPSPPHGCLLHPQFQRRIFTNANYYMGSDVMKIRRQLPSGPFFSLLNGQKLNSLVWIFILFYQPQRKAEKLFRPRSVCLVSLSHHFHGVSLRNFILSYLVIIKS